MEEGLVVIEVEVCHLPNSLQVIQEGVAVHVETRRSLGGSPSGHEERIEVPSSSFR